MSLSTLLPFHFLFSRTTPTTTPVFGTIQLTLDVVYIPLWTDVQVSSPNPSFPPFDPPSPPFLPASPSPSPSSLPPP